MKPYWKLSILFITLLRSFLFSMEINSVVIFIPMSTNKYYKKKKKTDTLLPYASSNSSIR